ASCPFVAVSVGYPSSESTSTSIFRMLGSSSTMRIVGVWAIVLPPWVPLPRSARRTRPPGFPDLYCTVIQRPCIANSGAYLRSAWQVYPQRRACGRASAASQFARSIGYHLSATVYYTENWRLARESATMRWIVRPCASVDASVEEEPDAAVR